VTFTPEDPWDAAALAYDTALREFQAATDVLVAKSKAGGNVTAEELVSERRARKQVAAARDALARLSAPERTAAESAPPSAESTHDAAHISWPQRSNPPRAQAPKRFAWKPIPKRDSPA
jgi:hypothetical protein